MKADPRQRPTSGPAWGFRRALGVTGWAALLVPGAAAGAGVAVAGGAGRPGPVRVAALSAAGAVGAVVVARVVSEVRWRRSDVSLQVTEPDEALDLLQAVRAEGVQADMVRADRLANAPAYALRYRAKDDRRVRQVYATQHA